MFILSENSTEKYPYFQKENKGIFG